MDTLKDPHLTAAFQRFCGVHYIQKEENATPKLYSKHTNGDMSSNDDHAHLKDRKKTDLQEKQEVTENQDYVIKYKFLHTFFTLSSSLGNEAFYLIFYPFCLWNVDAVVIRQVALVWCVCMYAGQALKDYLRWPRPSAPPVVKLESVYLQEYAMPSTHAMSSAAIPFMCAWVIWHRYEVSPWALLAVAVVWCVVVSLSRLYLGVHSVMDILCGVVLSFVIMAVMVPYINDLDLYQQMNPLSPIASFVISVALSTILYPDVKSGINSYSTKGDTVQIVAILAGVSAGAWINVYFGFATMTEPQLPISLEVPTAKVLALSVVRFFVGAITLVLLYTLLGKPVIALLSDYYGLPAPNKRHPGVETGYKYIVYYVMGLSISFLVPFLHCMFGLQRESFFSEIV